MCSAQKEFAAYGKILQFCFQLERKKIVAFIALQIAATVCYAFSYC